MNAVIDALKTELSRQHSQDSTVLVDSEKYEAKPFSPTHFKPLSPQLVKKTRQTVFVDGGQAEIFSSPSFCLSLIRVGYCIYEQRACVKRGTSEFYALITSHIRDDVYYSVKLFPIKGDYVPTQPQNDFHSFDKTLTMGARRSSPAQIVNVLRRFAELELATHLSSLLHQGDRIILDGSLQSSFVGEEDYLEQLSKKCKEHQITVAGLSKTSSLMTSEGEPYGLYLRSQSPVDSWVFDQVCTPIQEHFKTPFISFAQLHHKAKVPHCVESFTSLDQEFYNALSYYSADPVFLGYPYGLIEADRIARVNKQETSFLQTKFTALMGKSEELEAHLSASSAHDVLDKISF